MKTKKIIVYIMAMLCVASISGCGEKEPSSEESNSVQETTVTEITTEQNTEVSTTEITTTTTSAVKNFEENETITNILKQAYSYNGMQEPIISFDSATNKYVVLAVSNLGSDEFSAAYKTKQYDSIASSFSELCKSVLETVHIIDENIDVKVIFACNECIPLIFFENNSISFDFFTSESHEQISSTFEATLYEQSIGNVEVSYDEPSNTYTINLTRNGLKKDTISTEKWATIPESTSKLCSTLKNIVKNLDDTLNLKIEFLDISDNSPLLVVENEEIKYNYFE